MRYEQVPSDPNPTFDSLESAVSYLDYMGGPSTTIDVDEQAKIVRVEDENDPIRERRIAEAFRLIDFGFEKSDIEKYVQEGVYFRQINLSEYTRNDNSLRRYKSRIIGADGRTRELMEELTGASIQIGKKEIGIIGSYQEIEAVRTAITMVIQGAPHRTVYAHLEQTKV